MSRALELAALAENENEVPVGAVLVRDSAILGEGWNRPIGDHDPTAHAEMIALTSASNFLGSKYLKDCTLFVTLEPCVMCAAALKWAQVERIVYGASDPKEGFSRTSSSILHVKTGVVQGILEEEASNLLKQFFSDRRD